MVEQRRRVSRCIGRCRFRLRGIGICTPISAHLDLYSNLLAMGSRDVLRWDCGLYGSGIKDGEC